MTIAPDLVRKWDDAFREFDAFTRSLRPTDHESGRFYHLVTALSDAAKANYALLRKAFEDDDQTLIAWSCRNLLEVAIFTKFALCSKANADEFAAHRLIDGRQIGISLKKLDQRLNPGLGTSTFDALIEAFEKQMVDEGIDHTKKYLSAGDLAALVGMQDEYSTINKVCSKFVHPTAWSLFTADIGSERFPDARDIFYGHGTLFFMTVFEEVASHVRKWGLRHNPQDAVAGSPP